VDTYAVDCRHRSRHHHFPADVRALETAANLRSCVALQQEIRGGEFGEIVPPSLIPASLRVGAVALGAFRCFHCRL